MILFPAERALVIEMNTFLQTLLVDILITAFRISRFFFEKKGVAYSTFGLHSSFLCRIFKRIAHESLNIIIDLRIPGLEYYNGLLIENTRYVFDKKNQ